MAYKPSRKFVTEDAIAIDFELRKIAQEMTSTGSGTITGVTAGTAISGGGTTGTVTVDFAPSELSSVTVASDDKVIIADTSDSDNPKTVTASSIAALAPQGDITEVVAGTNLNGGGTSGSVTLNLDDDITITSVTADLYGPQHINVKNTSGGTLAKGLPVYATGSVGASGAVEVQASRADTASTMAAIGLLDEELTDGATGSATILGIIEQIDTSSYTINDDLYVAPTGGLTDTRPTGATHLVQKIGRVVRVHATTGEILVLGAGRTNDVPNGTLSNDISGNAATATALETARAINGVNFDGTGDITVTAAAGTLTGSTLNSGVTASSLTSVGTLSSLTVSGAFTPATVTASTVTVAADDLVLITDTSDSANVKKVTAQSIADLGGGGGSPAGSNTQVQFNDSGSFGASSNMVFDGTRLMLTNTDDVDLVAVSGSLITGGDGTAAHLAFDNNEIMAKSNATTAATLYLQNDGGTVKFGNNTSLTEWSVSSSTNKITSSADILQLHNTSSATTSGYIGYYSSDATRLGYVGYPANDDLYVKQEDSDGDLYIDCPNARIYYFAGTYHFWKVAGNYELRLDGTSLRPYTNEGLRLGNSGAAWDKFYLGQGSTFSSGGYWTLRSRDSDRQVMELVSSERFKKDIVDMPLEEAYQILDARPILYRGVDDDSSVPLEAGLSAESLHDAGYTYAIRYDEGHWGETPRSVYYEYLTAPIIKVLQDMQKRITYLEENQCQCQM